MIEGTVLPEECLCKGVRSTAEGCPSLCGYPVVANWDCAQGFAGASLLAAAAIRGSDIREHASSAACEENPSMQRLHKLDVTVVHCEHHTRYVRHGRV